MLERTGDIRIPLVPRNAIAVDDLLVTSAQKAIHGPCDSGRWIPARSQLIWTERRGLPQPKSGSWIHLPIPALILSFCILNISHVTIYEMFQRLLLEYSLFLYLTARSHQRTVFLSFFISFLPITHFRHLFGAQVSILFPSAEVTHAVIPSQGDFLCNMLG